MRFVGRCVTPARLGLLVGTLALAGCVVAPAAYDNPLEDHDLYGYGQYGYGQFGYGQYGYGPSALLPPGYYLWYPRPYGLAGYPPPEGDHDRHGHGKGPDGGRGDQDQGGRDRHRDRNEGTVVPEPGRVPDPVSRSGERRTAPHVVPDDGEPAASVRRRGGSRPQDQVPPE